MSRCSRLEKITNEVIDRTIVLYDENKLVEFWEAIQGVALMQEVKDNVCEIGG